jgi:hypothetical protein
MWPVCLKKTALKNDDVCKLGKLEGASIVNMTKIILKKLLIWKKGLTDIGEEMIKVKLKVNTVEHVSVIEK